MPAFSVGVSFSLQNGEARCKMRWQIPESASRVASTRLDWTQLALVAPLSRRLRASHTRVRPPACSQRRKKLINVYSSINSSLEADETKSVRQHSRTLLWQLSRVGRQLVSRVPFESWRPRSWLASGSGCHRSGGGGGLLSRRRAGERKSRPTTRRFTQK